MKKEVIFVVVFLLVVSTVAPALSVDKVPAGKIVLYTYTGALDNLVDIASCVTCTSTGTVESEVIVQFIDKDNDIYESSGLIPVGSWSTRTYCSRSSAFYSSEKVPPPPGLNGDHLDPGFIRVVVDKKAAKKIICDAVVLNSSSFLPSFIYSLNGERNNLKKYSTSK